jgi:curved DNA-binding protein CbpA
MGNIIDPQDCFTLLELTPPYTAEAVKRAYRRLAKLHHPDHGGAADHFRALQRAYQQAVDCVGS